MYKRQDIDGTEIASMEIKNVSEFKILGMDSMKQTMLEKQATEELFSNVIKMENQVVQDENGKHYPISTKKILEDIIKSSHKMVNGYIGTKPLEAATPQGMPTAPGMPSMPTPNMPMPAMPTPPGPTAAPSPMTTGGNPLTNAMQAIMSKISGAKR